MIFRFQVGWKIFITDKGQLNQLSQYDILGTQLEIDDYNRLNKTLANASIHMISQYRCKNMYKYKFCVNVSTYWPKTIFVYKHFIYTTMKATTLHYHSKHGAHVNVIGMYCCWQPQASIWFIDVSTVNNWLLEWGAGCQLFQS